MVKVNLKIYFKAVEWPEFHPFVAILNADILFDPNKFLWRGLFFDTSRLQQKHKRCCAAIHDGNFWGTQINVGIVDTQPCECRHQMFNCRNLSVAFN